MTLTWKAIRGAGGRLANASSIVTLQIGKEWTWYLRKADDGGAEGETLEIVWRRCHRSDSGLGRGETMSRRRTTTELGVEAWNHVVPDSDLLDTEKRRTRKKLIIRSCAVPRFVMEEIHLHIIF